MDKNYTALVLAFLVAAADANSINLKSRQTSKLLQARPLLNGYSVWLKLHDGYMTGLLNVSRTRDHQVKYFAKMLHTLVQLQFTDLKFTYKYLVDVMDLGPTGDITASLSRFVAVVDILLDLYKGEIELHEFSITDLGHLRVSLSGNTLTEWLVNPVLNVFFVIFDTIIIKIVEINIRNAIQDGINTINSDVKDVIKASEAYN